MMYRKLLKYRWLQQVGIFILLTFLVIVLAGCRYPVQPLELPPYGVASAIPMSTQTASPTATVTQTLVPTATPTPSVTPTETLTPTPSETATPTPTDTPTATPTETFTPEPTYTETTIPTATRVPGSILFAAIGDYGSDNGDEADVANLIKSWDPEFIITLGDNNYFVGAADHIDLAIGKHFHNYIYPYLGSFGEGADVNRYFPSIGNHDMMTDGGQPYYDYFTLPGNERYYDYTWGPVHFFVLNDVNDPDGVNADSVQGAWLQAGLAASTSAWNIVYMHYPPYSSSLHGSTAWAQWPFGEWGADVVMAGHDHAYERLEIGGVTYFVDGTGGLGLYNFKDIVEGSQVRYNQDYGAMRIQASENEMLFEFINRSGELIDSYEMVR